MADDDDDLYESVERMADRLKLEGRDRAKYIHDSMTRGGYRAVPQYVKDDDSDDDDNDDTPFFSRRRSKASGGDDSGKHRRTSRDKDDDWY